MKKVFLDCGSNCGQGLRAFISMYGIDKSWFVEAFEPNPLCNLEEHTKDLNNKVNIKINNSAIFDYNGTVEFSQMIENSEGSSVKCLMSKGVCADPNNASYRKHNSIIEVKCKDLSDILKQYDQNDFILVKLDIEGSEFNVIRKLLNDNTICKINDLYVEWHTQYVYGEDDTTVQELKNSIINKGVNLYDWH